MKNLSDEEAEDVLRKHGIKATDVGHILWHRMLASIADVHAQGVQAGQKMLGVDIAHERDIQ